MSDLLKNLIRGHLQTASIEYKNSAFVAPEIFPKILLDSPKLKIPVFNRGDTFRDEAKLRAPGTVTPISDLKTSYVNLDTYQYAYAEEITKEELWKDGKIGYPNLQLKTRKVMRVAEKLALSMERVAATVITGATWGDGNVGGEDAAGAWAASSGNTFIDDVDNAINTLRSNGVPPSMIRLATDFKTYQGVRKNGGITGITQYTKGSYPSAQQIADFMGIEKYVVAGGIYNSANEKADGSDFTSVDIWGGANNNGFGIVYFYPGPTIGLGDLCAGLLGYNRMENGQAIANYETIDERAHSYIYEGQHDMGAIQVAAPAAYAFKDTHTT